VIRDWDAYGTSSKSLQAMATAGTLLSPVPNPGITLFDTPHLARTATAAAVRDADRP
jgi:hypothetical protein